VEKGVKKLRKNNREIRKGGKKHKERIEDNEGE
jgi:hypothetical protein